MWITSAGEARENRDMIQVAKKMVTSTESKGLHAKNDDGTQSDHTTIAVNGVSLNISDTGKQKLEEQKNFLEFLQLQLDNVEQQKKASEKSWDAMGKCLTIAMRISSGDNVPTSDIKFLQEHDSELFMQAMAMRVLKKDPEDYDSVLDGDEDEAVDDSSNAKAVDSGMTTDGVEDGAGEDAGTAEVAVE